MPSPGAEGGPALVLVRHGQTDWNAAGRLQGHTDIPLNELGRSQALRNGQRLAALFGERVHGARFVASPLARAAETMAILREALGLARDGFATDPRLKELGFGTWEGRTWAEIADADPEGFARYHADRWNSAPPGEGGESYETLGRRALPVIETLESPTVVVAHGGVLRTYLVRHGALEAAKAPDVPMPQDRVLAVDRDGRFAWV